MFLPLTPAIALYSKSSNLNHSPLKQSKRGLANEICTALEKAADWSNQKLNLAAQAADWWNEYWSQIAWHTRR